MVWQEPNAHMLDLKIEIKVASLWHFNFLPLTTWYICILLLVLNRPGWQEKGNNIVCKYLGVRWNTWQEASWAWCRWPIPKLCHMYPSTLFTQCWNWLGHWVLICMVVCCFLEQDSDMRKGGLRPRFYHNDEV